MLGDREFRILLKHLDRPWAGYRKVRKGVKKRLRQRMEAHHLRTAEEYIALIERSPEEKAACEACLTVTISRFFRDRCLWQCLQEDLLPDLIQRFDAPIRAWSAGCACGEEPYSLAIVWSLMGAWLPLEILATDTRKVCLDRGKAGNYSPSSLKEVPEEIRSALFTGRRSGREFSILKEKLPAIQWRRHHLLAPPPPGPFHIIFLRNNLLTYYQGAPLKNALEEITSVLTPGGWLVVGSHEKPPAISSPLVPHHRCPWTFGIRQRETMPPIAPSLPQVC